MQDEIREIKSDVRDIKTDMGDIKETLARNTVSLEVHIKRTNINEDRIQKVEHWLLGFLASILVALVAAFARSLFLK